MHLSSSFPNAKVNQNEGKSSLLNASPVLIINRVIYFCFHQTAASLLVSNVASEKVLYPPHFMSDRKINHYNLLL
jgi:hypothetical protein